MRPSPFLMPIERAGSGAGWPVADHFIFMALALPLPALAFLGMAPDMAAFWPLPALLMAIAPLPALPLYMVSLVTT